MDGTFLKNDFFQEIFVQQILNEPIKTIIKLTSSKSLIQFKSKILNTQEIDSEIIQFMVNSNVLTWINNNRNRFKSVNIVTASPEIFAKKLLSKYNFTNIYGSTDINLKSKNKLHFILNTFGREFCYIGDSESDEIIFKHSFEAYKIKQFNLIKMK
jgi:hypothetical protein